jgi:hypothetical protein
VGGESQGFGSFAGLEEMSVSESELEVVTDWASAADCLNECGECGRRW